MGVFLRVALALAAVLALAVGVAAWRGCPGREPKGLGPHDGRLAPCPQSPNCVCSQCPDDPGHHVAPITVPGDPGRAMDRLAEVIRAMPRSSVVERRPDYLRATFASRVFGFVDDLELWQEPGSGLIQVRSAARLGWSDFGVNRARVESIRAAAAAASRGPGG